FDSKARSLAAASARWATSEWSTATSTLSYIGALLSQWWLVFPGRAGAAGRLMRVAAPWDPVGARQWHLGHRRRLYGQRDEIIWFQVVDVGLAAGRGQGGELHRERLQVVGHPPCARLRVEAALQIRVLRGHAHRAQPGVTVVAVAGRGADRRISRRGVVVLPVLAVHRPVAAQRDQRAHADRNRGRPERERLGDVCSRPDAPGDDELHLVLLA